MTGDQPNPQCGEVRVTVGGQDLFLVPTFGRLAKLEIALGRSLVQFAMDLGRVQAVTFQDVVFILDVMARDPKPPADELGALVVREGIVTVLPKLSGFLDLVLTGGPHDPPAGVDA